MVWKFITIPNNQLQAELPITVERLEALDRKKYMASVPGDFVSDMMSAGDLPDLFYSENILLARQIENLHVFYYTEVEAGEDEYLHFEGIDTVADIYVNGNKEGTSENAFLSVDVMPKWKKGLNSVVVHIKPICIEARKKETPTSSVSAFYFQQGLYMRKPTASFGWDILPRLVSAGIHRPVRLLPKKKDAIKDVFLITGSINKEKNSVRLRCYFQLDLSGDFNSDYTIKIAGKCGDASFEKESIVWHSSHSFCLDVQNAKLWYPHNYGDPNLYDVGVYLYYKGELVDTYELTYGIRTARLEHDENRFQFYVNEQPIFVMGMNWVPTSVFTGDTSRIDGALELLAESGANMVRVWGGGSYEDERFYEFCDRHGVLVWQDFMMACGIYPQDEGFRNILSKEAEYQIKRLRNHCSIVLWCGDNECDLCMESWSDFERSPDSNVLTRKVLPDVLAVHDHTRPYIPSSPYIYDKYTETGLVDWHLWTRTEHYSSPFFLNTAAKFVSEVGYTAFPCLDSLKKFLKDPENVLLEDGTATDEYILHGTAPDLLKNTWYDHKVPCTCHYAEMTFGKRAARFEDFIAQSQYTQAEAYKTWIETARIKDRSGILLWNLIEGWPGISEATVDYYFVKKPSYYFVKNAQRSVSVILSEKSSKTLTVHAVNDGNEEKELAYEVRLRGKSVCGGKVTLGAHQCVRVEEFASDGKSDFYGISFTVDGKEYRSHYQEKPLALDIHTYLENIKIAYEK